MSIQKVQKLDKRHGGRLLFKYYIQPAVVIGDYAGQKRTFHAWRTWCWETFGPGAERDMALLLRNENEWHWAWDIEHGNVRLYLKGDEELSWFTLRWQ